MGALGMGLAYFGSKILRRISEKYPTSWLQPPPPTHKTAQQGLGGGACNFADAGCLSRCVWLSGTLGQPLGRGWSNGAARVLLGGGTRGSKTAYFGANFSLATAIS